MEIKGNDEHETECANVQKERVKYKKSARHKCLLMQLKKLECHLVSTQHTYSEFGQIRHDKITLQLISLNFPLATGKGRKPVTLIYTVETPS